MKKFLIFIPLALLGILYTASCTKENVVESDAVSNSLLEDELYKIETVYTEGDIKYEGFVEGGEIETSASQAYKDKIKAELEKSYSKQVSYVKNAGNLVGVFKDGTCGSFSELVVNMDCEDSTPGSYHTGLIGASNVDSYGNVILKFCVVENTYFTRTNVDYAILMLTANLPSGVSKITRHFDNEDTSNGNYTTLDGGNIHNAWYGDCYFGSNDELAFYYYPASTWAAMPALGIEYCVLGTSGPANYRGFIYFDDENRRNANWCVKKLWNSSTSTWVNTYAVSIPNIAETGDNTKFYLSRAVWQ